MTFNYSVSPSDWLGIAPLVVLVIMALVVMLVDLALPHAGERSKHTGPANFLVLPFTSILGIMGAIAATIVLLAVGVGDAPNNHPGQIFNNMVGSDPGTLYAYLIILGAGTLGVLLSPSYLKRLQLVHQGEYYALLMFAMSGMMLMAASTSFIILFVGLEMFSLALYILCGYVARRVASQEAGMKYFLLSSFASAFLLFGIALTYAATGSTSFAAIAGVVNGETAASPLLIAGMGLLIVGFAFKVSGVPFQAWTPDVYQGAPAPVTAFMSVGTKVAAFVAFVRVFGFVFAHVNADWVPIVASLSILTMVAGNLMALVQSNVKRMLAYSSIAHGGYLLIGVVAGNGNNGQGATAILFYLSCYLFLNLGAFGVISLLERQDNGGYENSDLRGLWYRRPIVAGALAFFLISLAGFPPMAGFAAKYYLFYVALNNGHAELMIVGVLASVLGIYYYLRPVATMFMQERESEAALEAYGTMPARVPATPGRGVPKTPTRVPATPRRSGGTATAVAVKPAAKVAKSPLPVSVGAEQSPEEVDVADHAWVSWVALGLAGVGTLVLGVVLPFWLANLQDAAHLLLR
jgi:NADH-quinone oxidoreductase subunit N